MKKYTIIYCMDGAEIFRTKNSAEKHFIFVNYLSYNTGQKAIKKINIAGTIYYEIQIAKAIKIIKHNEINDYSALEKHFLNFLKAILADSIDELIVYLSDASAYSQQELTKIEIDYEQHKKYTHRKKYANTWISKDKIITLC